MLISIVFMLLLIEVKGKSLEEPTTISLNEDNLMFKRPFSVSQRIIGVQVMCQSGFLPDSNGRCRSVV